jgi:hypothetical protein
MLTKGSPLELAVEAIGISEAWRRMGLPGIPSKYCSAPWRRDLKPSMQIFDDQRFADYGTGKKGNVVHFVAFSLDISLSEAAQLLIRWHRDPSSITIEWRAEVDDGFKHSKADKMLHEIDLPEPADWNESDLEHLLSSRGLESNVGFIRLSQKDSLRVCLWKGELCWMGLEKKLGNAQVRPFYPARARWRCKALSLPAARTSVPIGVSAIEDAEFVFLTEGMPDWLAAATFVYQILDTKSSSSIGFVCMTGAGNSIADDAIRLFCRKKVIIIAHNDNSGIKAALRWKSQLADVCRSVRIWKSNVPDEDFNDWWIRNSGSIYWVSGFRGPLDLLFE